LYRFVYVSEARKPFTPEALEQLLVQARELNHASGITGMLLYRNRRFMQVLEGPREQVERTWSRIAQDKRHANFCVLMEEPVEQRLFADWSMGFAVPEGAAAASLPGYSHFLTEMYDPRPLMDDPTVSMQLLLAFKDRGHAAA